MHPKTANCMLIPVRQGRLHFFLPQMLALICFQFSFAE